MNSEQKIIAKTPVYESPEITVVTLKSNYTILTGSTEDPEQYRGYWD